MPAFRDVLAAVREAWTTRRAQAEESADAVNAALAEAAQATPSTLPDTAALAEAARGLAAREDSEFGGFGGAPKFPVATTLRFLQQPLVREAAPEAAAAAERALTAMAGSALRDADGGFFRYATRRDWTVPHYERMLTDNAQLLEVALDTGDEETARGIARFLLGTLRREGGGFGAAQDSESWIDGARSEGGYYLRPVPERATLEPPAVDDKVITGWNGLAVAALARAGATLGEDAWVAAAADAADAVLRTNRGADGALVRASLDGRASAAVATAADLALLADGLFALAAATGDVAPAVTGRDLLDEVLDGAGETTTRCSARRASPPRPITPTETSPRTRRRSRRPRSPPGGSERATGTARRRPSGWRRSPPGRSPSPSRTAACSGSPPDSSQPRGSSSWSRRTPGSARRRGTRSRCRCHRRRQPGAGHGVRRRGFRTVRRQGGDSRARLRLPRLRVPPAGERSGRGVARTVSALPRSRGVQSAWRAAPRWRSIARDAQLRVHGLPSACHPF